MTLVTFCTTTSYLEFSLTNLYVNLLIILFRIVKVKFILIVGTLINFQISIVPGLANPLANIHPILIIILFSTLTLNFRSYYVYIIWFILFLGGW